MTYFQVGVATQSQCPPWRIRSQGASLHLLSALQLEQRVTVRAHLSKAALSSH